MIYHITGRVKGVTLLVETTEGVDLRLAFDIDDDAEFVIDDDGLEVVGVHAQAVSM